MRTIYRNRSVTFYKETFKPVSETELISLNNQIFLKNKKTTTRENLSRPLSGPS